MKPRIRNQEPETRNQEPTTPEPLFCPNCSLPRRLLHSDGEVYKCTHCKSWWSPQTVLEYYVLFTRGGPAGYDPKTGFEAQARP